MTDIRRLPDSELTVMQALWRCGGNPEVFAASLCESGISREDIEELRELLKRREL